MNINYIHTELKMIKPTEIRFESRLQKLIVERI